MFYNGLPRIYVDRSPNKRGWILFYIKLMWVTHFCTTVTKSCVEVISKAAINLSAQTHSAQFKD